MIDIENIPILKSAICSLKETSMDTDSGSFMTGSMLNVVNFDVVKTAYISHLSLSYPPASNDALYVHSDGMAYFIEFKNGRVDKKEGHQIWLKIFDSLLMLTDIARQYISNTRNEISYILVYNEMRNPNTDAGNDEFQVSQSRDNIGKRVLEKAGKKLIKFNLERFEKLYFKEVFTVTENEFETDFLTKWTGSTM